MNCNQLASCLNEYMDREIPDPDRIVLDQHIQGCASCQGLLAREQRLRQALHQIPVAGPSADFYRHAMAGAVQTARPARRAHWTAAATAALAASVATWFVTSHFLAVTESQTASPVATITMAMDEARTVNLVFNSESAIDDARLSLRLPPGVELASHRNRQEFRWKTHLHPGNNVLPLDLVVRDGSGGDLIASLSHAGDHKTFRVRVSILSRSNIT
jgi:hypothetical protein